MLHQILPHEEIYTIYPTLGFSIIYYAQSGLKLLDIGTFKTSEGAYIEECKIGYRTLGSLDQDSSNVIVWPTWFDGTSKSLVKP